MSDFQAEGKRILLVEGPDDWNVVKNICSQLQLGIIHEWHHGKPASGTQHATQGKEALLQSLPQHLKASDISSLGIILDADESLNNSWQSVRHTLIRSGYADVPKQPFPDGTVLPAPTEPTSLLPRVGIWIMPNNQISGTLEDFLSFLIPDGDALLPHAQDIISNLPEKRFTDAHRPKALMHTWLAWQKEPGKPYGQAITTRYLDTSLPVAKTFADWLKRTFFE